MAFDGAFDADRRLGGAGGAAWVLDGADWVLDMEIIVAADNVHSIEHSEAIGLRELLGCLRTMTPRDPKVTVVGDCLPLVDYAAGTGGIKDSPARTILERPLADVACLPLQLKYTVIPGRENGHPHDLAQQGLAAARAGELGTWANLQPRRHGAWADPARVRGRRRPSRGT